MTDEYQFNNDECSLQINEISIREEDMNNLNDNCKSDSDYNRMEIDDCDKQESMKLYPDSSELMELSTNMSKENIGTISNKNDSLNEDWDDDSYENECFEEEEEEKFDDSLDEYQKDLIEEGYNEIYEDLKEVYNENIDD